MTQRFPQTRTFTGFNAPSRIEFDLHDLEVVQGCIPGDLNGAFYRVQPDPAWPPRAGDDIPLNGDGLVTAFRFDRGRVSVRGRYVRTEKFVAERTAGRALFGAYRNPYTDDPSVAGLSRGTANTNLLWFGGRLLALKEDSHPVEIDPVTLDTVGPWSFGGQLSSLTFTAHPKIDPYKGELVAFGYAAKGETTPDIAIYTFNMQGELLHEAWLEAPYSSMVHDFGVTEHYILLPISPLISKLDWLKAGKPHFAWDGNRQSWLGVLPRRGRASDIHWHAVDTCFSSHTMNAFEADGRIHYDTPVGGIVVFPFFPDVSGQPWDPARAAPRLERWSLDPSQPNARVARRQLAPLIGEFPRIDERFATRRYRHGWMACESPRSGELKGTSLGGGMTLTGVAHIDHGEQRLACFTAEEGCSLQEPQFVPRQTDAEEGDGYLLAVVNRLTEMRSDLIILDAREVTAGPLATVRLPLRLRNGLHGTWIGADELKAPGGSPAA